ncbi:MAG: AMP-binding protein [Nocardioides sp.]
MSVSLWPVAGGAVDIVPVLDRWLSAAKEPRPLLIETSGSTGAPKRVILSRSAVVASAAATRARLAYAGGWALALPPTYVAGIMVMARSLLAGQPPVVLPATVSASPVTGLALSLVPTQLHRLLADPDGARWLAEAEVVLVGGGPVDPALRERAGELGVATVATYGASETCGGCVYDGLPLPGVDVRIEATGRITIAGPTLFSGYAADPELTAATLVDGRFHTDDHGEFGADGRLRVLGRLDEVVVSGGVNVPGGRVAARIRQHPAVRAAEVVGAADPEWGQRVLVWVVPTDPGVPPTLAELRDWVGAELPRAWAPREVRLLDELPQLAHGKVDRATLQGWSR